MKIEAGSTMLRPLKTSETVARDIVNYVVAGGLGNGDSLPSEARMLEQYGVSRESLREGLRLLEAQGLITLRRGPGGGPVVGAVDPANLGRVSTLYYHLVGATYGDLFEAWTVAEGYLAERAARNEDRTLVRATLEPYLTEQHSDLGDLEALDARHTKFHTDVGALAGNRVMQLSLMAIGQTVTHHIANSADLRDIADILLHDRGLIAAAIIAGKPIKSRDLMRVHLEGVAGFYDQLAGGDILHRVIEWR